VQARLSLPFAVLATCSPDDFLLFSEICPLDIARLCLENTMGTCMLFHCLPPSLP
jgi:hypothetical protein